MHGIADLETDAHTVTCQTSIIRMREHG